VTHRVLAGLQLVVTRPAAQAGPFIALAEAAGASCIALPALEIEAVQLAEPRRDELLSTRWDWAIYTSANAVAEAARQLPGLSSARVAAVGGATARALLARGKQVDALPEGRAESEGLLLAPGFAQPRGRRMLIVKGVGGRELLRAELTRRGAMVQVAELYRRRRSNPSAATLASLHDALKTGSRLAVVVTSAEVLEALLAIVPPVDLGLLRNTTLFVPGPRVADTATRLGWTGPIVPAATAEDQAILQAVLATEGRSADAC
jgi:uroporphyrinogen-III synthase